MSYGAAHALQSAIYDRLSGDATLTGLVGTAIYDALPAGKLPQTYVTLGPEEARVASDRSGQGAWHRITISVVTDGAGFAVAKSVATAISDALIGAPLILSRGRLSALNFNRARARREGTADLRRIDLTFNARIDDTP